MLVIKINSRNVIKRRLLKNSDSFTVKQESNSPVIFKQRKKIRIVKNNLKRIFIFVSGVFGMPARSCEDFINH
jgi:hypothetical protein